MESMDTMNSLKLKKKNTREDGKQIPNIKFKENQGKLQNSKKKMNNSTSCRSVWIRSTLWCKHHGQRWCSLNQFFHCKFQTAQNQATNRIAQWAIQISSKFVQKISQRIAFRLIWKKSELKISTPNNKNLESWFQCDKLFASFFVVVKKDYKWKKKKKLHYISVLLFVTIWSNNRISELKIETIIITTTEK